MRLFIVQGALGLVVATLFLAALVLLDIGGLGRLLTAHWGALLLLWFFLGLTFASVHIGTAVMGRGGADPDDGEDADRR